jgi:peptidoglycan hydrolase-like protein with peptidoglycan-binding domain
MNKKSIIIISLAVVGLVAIQAVAIAVEETTSLSPAPVSAESALSVVGSTSTAVAVPETNLQAGTVSENVKKVQEILKSLGYLGQETQTTNYFGAKTKEAILKFQQANNLPVTGNFGPATRHALKNRITQEEHVSGAVTDIACMRTVVEKRESTLISAYDVYVAKIKAARETKKTALLAAWNIQDAKERKTAIKQAWKTFQESSKTAWKEFLTSKKTGWTQFEQDRKNCKAPSTGESAGLEVVDAEVAE